MFVPSGKKIRLISNGVSYLSKNADTVFKYGNDYEEIPMYLGEDLNVRTSSQYSRPFQSMQESAANLGLMVQTAGAITQRVGQSIDFGFLERAGSSLSNTTFQSEHSAFQLWKFSDPISFSFTVKFFLGIADIYDAKIEVYYPTLRLMSLVLPSIRAGRRSGIGQIANMVAPGPTVADFLDQAFEGRSITGNSYSIYIGKTLRLNDIIIKEVDSTFSHEVDERGFPIYSVVRISIETQRVGTTNIIEEMLSDRHEDDLISAGIDEAEIRAQEQVSNTIADWARSLIGL